MSKEKEIKNKFFDYLKQFQTNELSLLLQNIGTFTSEFNQSIELSPEKANGAATTAAVAASTTTTTSPNPKAATATASNLDEPEQDFNEQALEKLIQLDESEIGIISNQPGEETSVAVTKKTKLVNNGEPAEEEEEQDEEEETKPRTRPRTRSTTAAKKKAANLKLKLKQKTKSAAAIQRSRRSRKRTLASGSTSAAVAAVAKKRKPRSDSASTRGFTLECVNELVKHFSENDYPSTKQKEEIGKKTGLSVRQISAWYRNRRKKLQRRKRVPTHLVNYLVKEYNKNKQPNEADLERMSLRTKLPVDCVQSWFEKKRSKKEKSKRAFAHTDYLNKKYNENKYPSKQQIKQMAFETNLTAKKITIWFRSRRARLKQTHLKGFTPQIQTYLQDKYNQNKYPDSLSVLKMSLEIKVSTFQINNWFKRRRFVLGQTKSNKYSPQLVNYLTECYNRNENPSKDDIMFMSFDTNLTTNQITQWFNDHRHKQNRTVKNIQVITNNSTVESIVIKKKRSAKYPKHVVDYLIKEYEANKYPEAPKIQEIVAATNLATQQIYTWFNDRRKKFKQTTPNKFPSHVIDYLVQNYEQVAYPSSEEIEKMALCTRLTTQQINQWYMHRRHKLNKKKKADKTPVSTAINNTANNNNNNTTTLTITQVIPVVHQQPELTQIQLTDTPLPEPPSMSIQMPTTTTIQLTDTQLP